jgi:protoporphyrinogen oxidase
MYRRKFLQHAAALIGAGAVLQRCTYSANSRITGSIVGANSKVGHLLRQANLQSATHTISTETVIVGAGVSGLSAARCLHQQGHTHFLLYELAAETGGNAASGQNTISAYPWGAHYVPLPNNDLLHYLQFLKECDVITGYSAEGLPIYNEYHLCFAPQERLYINGHWQEGVIPHFGIPQADMLQTKKFLAQMEQFRQAKGADGKPAFAIPVNASSNDAQFTQLDTISMEQWLHQNGYQAKSLHWYCNYCCRDDFGSTAANTSAWAGIHYFAARKGVAANAPPQSILTWPEGTGWLANKLKEGYSQKIHTGYLVLEVKHSNNDVLVKVMNTTNGVITAVYAKHCIMAVPQYIAARLLPQYPLRQALVSKHFIYQPWMVANITSTAWQERKGAPLSWDNVLYNGNALGYVNACHQQLQQKNPVQVFTYYCPLTHTGAKAAREQASKKSYDQWVKFILDDLKSAHPNLDKYISHIDIWIWGHGMISPQQGFIQHPVRRQLQQPLANRIFFAHSDVAGISIFEEAFYQGIEAANLLLGNTG